MDLTTMDRLNVLHINTLDSHGGASQVAIDLIQHLEENCHLLVREKTSDNPKVIELKKELLDHLFLIIDKILWKLGRHNSFKSFISFDSEGNYTYKKLSKLKEYREADIIHLHNLHGGYFDLDALLKIAEEKKIVWTLHDMWAITGGEAYTFENENYKKGIGYTPYYNHYPLLNPIIDRRQYFLEKKKAIYKEIHNVITIVPVSSWLENCFRDSFVYDPSIRLRRIYNGINISVFRNKEYRKPGKPKILFFNFDNPFKGSHLFTGIIQKIEKEFDLWVIGEKLKIKIRHKHFPYINDRMILSEVYNHTDILIVPSLAESFGLVVAEAMACGVCVIGSNVGGIPEILDNSCGFLFNNNDSENLLEKINLALSDMQAVHDKGKIAEQRVHENFTLVKNCKQYSDLYHEIFKSGNPKLV